MKTRFLLLACAAMLPCPFDALATGDLHVEDGTLTVDKSATIGAGTDKGNLEVIGKTGSGAGLGLKVSGDGGVYFPSGNSSILPGISSGAGFLYIPAKSALRIGSFSAGNLSNIGNDSFATSGGQASGYGAIAIGSGSYASGSYSIAMGSYTEVSGNQSVAVGDSNIVTGTLAVAVNSGNNALAEAAFAGGLGSTVTGKYAAAFGEGTTAQAYGSFVIGHFNTAEGDPDQPNATNPLFVIGNGSYGNPHDALVVYKNGDIKISKPQGDILMGEFD